MDDFQSNSFNPDTIHQQAKSENNFTLRTSHNSHFKQLEEKVENVNRKRNLENHFKSLDN